MALLEALRLALGLLLVLVAPGLAWSFVVAPQRRPIGKEGPGLDAIERGVLAVGISVATVPLVVFLLNYVAKVPVTPLVTSLVLGLYTLAPLAWIMARRRRAGREPEGLSNTD